MSLTPRRLALIIDKAHQLHEASWDINKSMWMKLWTDCTKEAMDYFPVVDKIWQTPIEILVMSEYVEVAEWRIKVMTNDDIIALARKGKMISAIKLYRERMDCSLKEATDWVRSSLEQTAKG